MESSFTFARVRGIPIGAHWSWLGVFALVVWSLASALFPRTYPGLSDWTYIIMGLSAGILFFGSILLHELGHAFQALKEGMVIDGITLWLFGGVARFRGMFSSAGAEFRIAIAGPVVSIAIAAFFGGLTFFGTRVDWGPELQGTVDYLFRINLLVVGFNLIPALPLDGGRVLRAWLWHKQGDFAAATTSAARAGKGFGLILIGVGILEFLTADAGTGGLWFVFLGWFLIQAARSEAMAGEVRAAFGSRTVRDLMTASPATASSDLSVTEFLDGAIASGGHSVYPVMEEGRFLGLASLKRAGDVPQDERDGTSIRRVMDPAAAVSVLDPETPVIDVIDELQEEPRRAAVVEDGRLVGVLALSDLVRSLEEQKKAGGNGTKPSPKGSGVLVWIIVGAIMLGAGGYLYHPPLAVITPGSALNVVNDITINGVETEPVNGKYILTSVSISQPNALEVAWEWLQSDSQFVSVGDLIPEGVDEEQYFRNQREVFRESEQLAAAAAAQATGMDVTVTGTGAQVVQVIEGTPASRHLAAGDVIVEIDGEPVKLVTDLQRIVRAEPAGTTFDVTVERGGNERTFNIESERLPGGDGAVGIGVQVTTRGFKIDLPFEAEFDRRAIGGPSAGFVYSLAISDMLDPGDYAKGRSIAATGTIDVNGVVGEIGEPDLKAIAAEGAGASMFLVPAGQLAEVDQEGLEVIGVRSLQEAIELLENGEA